MKTEDFSKVTPQIFALSQYCMRCDQIDPNLYTKHDVKRGLRDLNGKGVVAGLTEISEVCSSCVIDGQTVPCDGKLYYRGVDVEDIVRGYIHDDRFGFEEVVYLLLFGYLPNKDVAWNNFTNSINQNIEVVLFHDYNKITLSILPDAIKYLKDNNYILLPLFYESNMINK